MPDPVAPPASGEPLVRRAVVVLGMHRSGTSLVAGCLQRLGVDFGLRLMPPNPDNPHGYFEHNDVVNLHDRLLLALDRSWDDSGPLPVGWPGEERLLPYRAQLLAILRRDFPAAPLWGLKDPRLCRLLPWWESVWPEVGSRPLFVLVRRAPQEVAASLARREGMSTARSHLLWLRHVLEAERWSRPYERILVNFEDFRVDEAAALAPVRRKLDLPDSPASQPATLVDPTLGRGAPDILAPDLPPWVREADAAFCLGLTGDEGGMRSRLDAVRQSLLDAEPFLCPTSQAVSGDLRHQLAAARKQARWYEEEWQKARERSETLQARLEQKQAAMKPSSERALSEMINKSNLMKYDLSKKRKTGLTWKNFWSSIFGRRQ